MLYFCYFCNFISHFKFINKIHMKLHHMKKGQKIEYIVMPKEDIPSFKRGYD